MLFQTFDEKEQCVAFYADGKIHKELPLSNLSKTWNYSQYLKNSDIQYADLYCLGKSMGDVCPEELKEQWKSVYRRLLAFYRSFAESKISLQDNCFYDLVPERFLLLYCDLKDKITEHVLKNFQKPENYDFLLKIKKLATDIRFRELNLDFSNVKLTSKIRKSYKVLKTAKPYIDYNIFGTKTGRLTTKAGSFPILTMQKSLRSVIQPHNDCFLELDFNAAELRTVLALLERTQPSIDLHEWNVNNVYGGLLTREQAKKRIFAWLYNPNSKDDLSERFYDRGKIKESFFDGTEVKTTFNRKIKADDFHAFNYVIQSTSSDLFLEQVIRVYNYLKDKKSNIAFTIHDSLIIDFDKDELSSLKDLSNIFSQTRFGEYLVNLKIGKDFGAMKEWKL